MPAACRSRALGGDICPSVDRGETDPLRAAFLRVRRRSRDHRATKPALRSRARPASNARRAKGRPRHRGVRSTRSDGRPVTTMPTCPNRRRAQEPVHDGRLRPRGAARRAGRTRAVCHPATMRACRDHRAGQRGSSSSRRAGRRRRRRRARTQADARRETTPATNHLARPRRCAEPASERGSSTALPKAAPPERRGRRSTGRTRRALRPVRTPVPAPSRCRRRAAAPARHSPARSKGQPRR